MQDGSRKYSATISADMGRSQAGEEKKAAFCLFGQNFLLRGSRPLSGAVTQKENEKLVEANKGKTE